MHCAMPAAEPDTTTRADTATDAAAAADGGGGAVGTDEVGDSWQMDSLAPPPALLQPVKYPPMHIFVRCY